MLLPDIHSAPFCREVSSLVSFLDVYEALCLLGSVNSSGEIYANLYRGIFLHLLRCQR